MLGASGLNHVLEGKGRGSVLQLVITKLNIELVEAICVIMMSMLLTIYNYL